MYIHRADQRGGMDLGWLRAQYSFSFAQYYDPSRMGFGALRVLNDDWIKGGMGFGMHPHSDMEIITIMLGGSLRHRDSMGHTGVICPGEIQVMSAGTGVQHSEVNADPHEPAQLLQIWIEPSQSGVTPRYDQATYELSGALTPLVGAMDSDTTLQINADARLSMLSLSSDSTIYTSLSDHHGTYVYIIDGTVDIDGETLGARDAAQITDQSSIELSTPDHCRAVLIDVLL